MDEPTTDDAKPIVIIDKRGDVLLKVGTEPNEQTTLFVSSTVLSLASNVFEAMFNGGFAEGQNLSSTSPYELPLPDDDAKQMTIICELVHMQTKNIPNKLSIEDLASLAVLCDKYNCANGVRGWSRVWLSCYGPQDPGFAVLLTVSYLFDLPQEFRNISQTLICHYLTTSEGDFTIKDQSFLPIEVIHQLGNDQNRLQKDAGTRLFPEQTMELLRHSITYGCEYSKEASLRFFQTLQSSELLPISVLTLHQYLERATAFSEKDISSTKTRCPQISKRAFQYCIYPVALSAMLTGIKAVLDSAQGYCLDCVNTKVHGTGPTKCRVAHDAEMGFSK